MKNYRATLTAHLGKYAKRPLGVFEKGTYRGRRYSHILPSCMWSKNLLEPYRADFLDYLQAHPSLKLDQHFHHLNSSQAFAFNLFYPYFSSRGCAANVLSAALGINADVLDWEFEHIVEKKEGTNVDVMWRTSSTASVFCEVKLSESAFGATNDDERHRQKLTEIYYPRLKSLISTGLLENKMFFKNYQLLRNVSLLAENVDHRLVIFFPRENDSLERPLRAVLADIHPTIRGQITVIYVEDCLSNLQENASLSPELRIHASKLAEKYVLSSFKGMM
jgi:hypothetical protein